MNEYDVSFLPQLFFGLLIFCRTLGLLALLPLPGLKDLPRQIRIYVAVAISFFITIIYYSHAKGVPDSILHGAFLMASELLLGLFFSAVLLIFFCCLNMAGDLISRMSGLSLATVFDPAWGESIPVLSHFFLMLGIVVFLLTGGLEAAATGYLDSFQSIPPGQSAAFLWNNDSGALLSPEGLPMEMLRLGTVLAVRISIPVILSALTVFITAGIIGRMVPQINVMLISFNGGTLLLFAVLAVSIGFGLRLFQESLNSLLKSLFQF